MDKRIRAMKKLRRQGATYEAIGQQFGMSRQRVHQILNPPEKKREMASRLIEKFPDFPTGGHPDEQRAWLEAFPRFMEAVQGEGDE